MQVTQQASHLTHAVINAGEQISFGVSDDPMFFHMMYSSLYGNPMRAAFREPLCNAWDANIDNGKENVPLEITLTESSVTIKDSGKGIPHDKIADIYLTLGRSTKVNDSGQTGGFGLGCKAPFAYADHFEVRSSCNGVCTIYRLIKVCPTKGGRPSATVIASFPTTETGLQVTIPFTIHGHDESGKPISRDYPKIKTLLMEAISQGGILATVNGVPVPLLPLDRKPGSWAISSSFHLSGHTNHQIFVRYGSVVYPVEDMEGMEGHYEIRRILRDSFYHNNQEIVFQAPPDSIVIPPSREAISAHPKTAETMNALFKDFLDAVRQASMVVPKKSFQQVLNTLETMKTKEFYDALHKDLKNFMPNNNLMADHNRVRDDVVLLDAEELMGVAIYQKSHPFQHFDKKYLTQRLRLKVLERSGMLSHHMATKLTHRKIMRRSYWDDRHEWIMQFILKPLLKRIVRAGLNPNHLYVFNEYANRACDSLTPYTSYNGSNFEDLVAMARKNLVICYAKGEVWDMRYGATFSALTKANGGRNGVLVYLCPKSNGSSARAREVFGKFRDWNIHDLTEKKDEQNAVMRQSRSLAAKAKRMKVAELKAAGLPPEEPESKVEKLPGFPSLRNGNEEWYFNFRAIKASGGHRVEAPRFWLDKPEFLPRIQAVCLPGCNKHQTIALLQRFLNDGMLIQNRAQQKYVDKHQLPEFKEYLIAYLERHLGACKQKGLVNGQLLTNVHRAVRPNDDSGCLLEQKTRLFRLVMGDSWLRNKFGLKAYRVSQRVESDLILLDTLTDTTYLEPEERERMVALRHKIATPIVKDEAKALFVLVSSIPQLRYVDIEELEEHLESSDINVRMAARHFIMNVLNKK